MALLRHKNPGWFTYDNFLKTLLKAVPFLKLCPKSKRALPIFYSNRGQGLLRFGDITSQRNDIYEIHKKRVNILPKKLKQIHCNNGCIKWNVHYKLNFSQLISIVYTTNGSPCWTRTNDLRINRASFYIISRFTAFKNMQFYLNIISFSQHFKSLPFARLRRLCSKIVPKFFRCSWCRRANPPRLRLWRVAGDLNLESCCHSCLLPGILPCSRPA